MLKNLKPVEALLLIGVVLVIVGCIWLAVETAHTGSACFDHGYDVSSTFVSSKGIEKKCARIKDGTTEVVHLEDLQE